MFVPHLQLNISPPSRLFNLINRANPTIPRLLDSTVVTLGNPTPMAMPGQDGANTSLTLTAIPGNGYSGTATVYYTRTDLSAKFAGGVIIDGDGIESWTALAAAINAATGTSLTASDFPNTPLVVSQLPSTLVVNIVSGSLLYQGSFTVNLTSTAPSLQAHVLTTSLPGLTPPPAPIPF